MNRFAILLSFLFPLLAAAAPQGLQVVYEVQFKSENPKDTATKMTSKYFIQKGSVRFEMSGIQNPMGDLVVIGNSNPKTSVILFPARKAYMDAPQTNPDAVGNASQADVAFKSTGRTKEIAGYKCEVVERDLSDRHEEACTASKLKQEFDELQNALPSSKNSKNALPKGMNGLPLEYRVTGKAKGEQERDMLMKVTELKRENLNPLLFVVPKEYTKQEFPSPAQLRKSLNMDETLKDAQKKMRK